MPRLPTVLMALSLTLSLPAVAAPAESHRATRLGSPSTRFAPPLKTPEDLRRTLLSETLRDDVEQVARKSGFSGDMADLLHAAETAPIKELGIPPKTRLPAMSTRKKGKAEVLHNVLWAGKKPIDAYEFSFISGERRYRVVTPKACSNFWVEEQLPPSRPELALNCSSPAVSTGDSLVEVCCTLANIGELAEPRAVLALPYPAGAKVRCVSGGADVSDATRLTWKFDNLASGEVRTVCANFTPLQPGTIAFAASATAQRSATVSGAGVTEVQAAKTGGSN
ncbi:MAG: hypothetical protein HGA75_02620 [Thiobacillus sp.]|nr:hypothetical protein [Thiobacillus sp.]